MSTNQIMINGLQAIVTNLSQLADGHAIQSKIFESKGFSKLAQKYAEHALQERAYISSFVDRILSLKGTISNEAKSEMNIYQDPADCLKYDIEVSKNAKDDLMALIQAASSDLTTFDVLKDYYKDEEEDVSWGEQQLELIEAIGKKNWLLLQI